MHYHLAIFPGNMRAGRVTFLFGVALIHISLADKPIEEERPVELADGQAIIKGYIFDDDEIFVEKAESIIQYSTDILKNQTTDEGRYYLFCNKVGYDIVCLDVMLTNSTNMQQELDKPVSFESSEVLKSGYIFDGDETFTEKTNSLLNYTYQVMKKCQSAFCRQYTYCTGGGHDIVCLSVMLSTDKDFQNEDKTGISDVRDPYFKIGNIFDGDEVFANQSKILLNYTRKIMTLGLSKIDRTYMVCYKVNGEIICLTVSLSRGEHEFISDLYSIENLDINPYGALLDSLITTEENYHEFPGGSDIDADKLTFAVADLEKEDNTKEDMAEDNEDVPLD